jgi:hypothetical protein
MTNNNFENKIIFYIGFFLTPCYQIHFIPINNINRNYNNNYVNHYSGNNCNNNKLKTKIRNFSRSSKVNF